jgi:hypothetical protein
MGGRERPGLLLVLWLTGCGGRTELRVGSDASPDDGVVRSDASAPGAGPAACPGLAAAPADRPPSPAEHVAFGDGISAVAVDDQEIFYSAGPGGFGSTTLHAAQKRGAAIREVAPILAHHLRVDEEFIWAGGGGYGLQRIRKRDGAIERVDTDAFDFDIDDTNVYWTRLFAGVWRRSKAGGPPAQLASGDESNAFQGISVYDGWVHWVEYGDDRILRVRAEGGDVEVLAEREHFPRTVVADCRDVYFSIGNYGEQIRKLRVGSMPTAFASVGGAIALDTASLYVQNTAETWRVSLATGKVTSLGGGSDQQGLATGSLAVDDEHVYWAAGSELMRARK